MGIINQVSPQVCCLTGEACESKFRLACTMQMLSHLFCSGELHSVNSMCLAVQLLWRSLCTPGTCGTAFFRTQDRAHSLTRPLSGHPSHHTRLQTPSSFLAQPRTPVTGVAGKGIAPVHCIPHQGSRGTWKQGCFQPPWASMRRKPGVASAPPSDWGWVALNVDQVWFGCMLCLFACYNSITHFVALYQVWTK